MLLGSAAGLLFMGAVVAKDAGERAAWPLMGRDLANSRSQPAENQIGPGNVAKLTNAWTFTTGGDVSATPTVVENTLYFPDWGGNLYAVQAQTGHMLWSHRIEDYNHRPGSISRVSPAV